MRGILNRGHCALQPSTHKKALLQWRVYFFIWFSVLNPRQAALSSIDRCAAKPTTVHVPSFESDADSTDILEEAITPPRSKAVLRSSAVSKSTSPVPVDSLKHKQTAPIATSSRSTIHVGQKSPQAESHGRHAYTASASAPIAHSQNRQNFRVSDAVVSSFRSASSVSPHSTCPPPLSTCL